MVVNFDTCDVCDIPRDLLVQNGAVWVGLIQMRLPFFRASDLIVSNLEIEELKRHSDRKQLSAKYVWNHAKMRTDIT